MKCCGTCKEKKENFEFSKNKHRKDGYHHICKICTKKYYIKNKEKIKVQSLKYYNNNKDNALKQKRFFYTTNSEILKEKSRLYYLNNKEYRNKKSNYYIKNRCKFDFLFKFKRLVRSRIYYSIKNKNYSKHLKTESILGCTIDEFRLYIENKFTEGMSWDNQGEWHLDHIYPVSLAKSEEEIIKLNHYSNFQPLWAIDNLRKSNKILNGKT